jgi:pseudomonalisin
MSLLVRRLLSITLFLGAIAAPAQTRQPDRVAAHPDLRATTRLVGHIPAWATAANDAGSVPDATSLHLTVVLARSAERQAAFTQLLADQQNPASSSYHHWLTPQQIGTLYGPTQHDLSAVTTWLAAQGLAVTEIAPSRIFVNVTAPVSTTAAAFSTSFRYFNVAGPDGTTPHFAAITEPAIPAALASVILSINGLVDTPVYPTHHSRLAPMSAVHEPTPNGTIASTGMHYITPNDFAVLYDLNPVYQSGITGAGEKIAVLGRSRVLASDITLYEGLTALPAIQPNIIVPPTAVDPGITNTPDQDEATVDVDRVLGTAPGAQTDLVVASTASGGITLGAQYAIQTLLDPVLSISFSACESTSAQTDDAFWNTLFSQAAAEGISVFVSSGDSGAAGCQVANQPPVGVQTRSINTLCATGYATCVGGTQFADLASPATYWSTTNNTGLESAISYIPEGAWNEPTDTSTGATTYIEAATGGGVSTIIPKPAWQTGTGVPADGLRDVPDISFSASGHNGYLVCLNYAGADCVKNVAFFSGTSVSAPSMAAIGALFDQKTGIPQGNLNPLLYGLATTTPAAFHDATLASSGLSACDLTIPSVCNNSTPSATGLSGGLIGYALTTGYDQATGLGSLDVNNFFGASTATTGLTITPATASLTVTAGATTGNTDLLTVNSLVYAGTATLGCTVSFNGPGTATSTPICSLSPSTVSLPANGSATSTLTINTSVAAAQVATAASAPLLRQPAPATHPSSTAQDLTSAALCSLLLLALIPSAPSRRLRISLSSWRTLPTVLLLLAGFASLAGLTACSGASTPISPNPLLISATDTVLTASSASIFAGSTDTFTAVTTNIGFNTTLTPTGTVRFFQQGITAPVASVSLPASGTAVTPAIPFAATGSYVLTAVYSGDNNFSTSTSQNIPITVVPVGTTPGSYTVTITATTPSGLTTTTPINLTVQ